MNATTNILAKKSNVDLLAELHDLIRRGHEYEAKLLGYLAEVDARRLYAEQAAPSMFAWCLERLGFSEDMAYRRIQACRAARRFPAIFTLMAQGKLHLTAINLLAPHFTEENHAQLCEAARGKSKRDVERLVATHFPKADAPTVLRKLPTAPNPPSTHSLNVPAEPSRGNEVAARNLSSTVPVVQQAKKEYPCVSSQSKVPRAIVMPLSVDRFRLQVTLEEKTREKLLRAQELLRHKLPEGDIATVLDIALSQLCESLEARKFATLRNREAAADAASVRRPAETVQRTSPDTPSADSPAPAQVEDERGAAAEPPQPSVEKPTHSRYVPRALRREVAFRDGYQCTFVAADGKRCQARGQLEFHHLKPYGRGGQTTVSNISLRCKCHNLHAAIGDFGKDHMERAVRPRAFRSDTAKHAASDADPGRCCHGPC